MYMPNSVGCTTLFFAQTIIISLVSCFTLKQGQHRIIIIIMLISYFSSSSKSMMQEDIVSTCAQVTVYSGDICRNELLSLQTCLSDVTSPPPALNIPSSIDQKTSESDAILLLNGLSFLNPSQQCKEAVMPFLCISIFNLCDSSNTLHTATREDCLYIRDDVCVSEWSTVVEILGADVLPVCEELPVNSMVECTGKWNFSLNS